MSTQEVFDIKVIFDNFAQMLKLCLKNNAGGGSDGMADVVQDTRLIWELCLHSEHEHDKLMQEAVDLHDQKHQAVVQDLMRKLDLLHAGYNADYQMYLNDRQSWLEREAEYLRRLEEKPGPAPVPVPVVQAPAVKAAPLNASVAIRPRPSKARDLKSQMITLDYELEANKAAPSTGWGIQYDADSLIVEIYLTATSQYSGASLEADLIADLAKAANVSENRFSLKCVDSPDPSQACRPMIYCIRISGGQYAGYELVRDLAGQSNDDTSALRQGALTRHIMPYYGASLPLPPSELKNLAPPSVRTNEVSYYTSPEATATKAKKLVHQHKAAVLDAYAADFISKAGPDAWQIVSQLASRHQAVDSRLSPGVNFHDVFAETWDPYRVSRDMGGERLVGELASILQQSGMKFEDPTFPAHDISLFANPALAGANANVEQSFRKDLDPFLAGVEGIEWKRPQEIGDIGWECKMFSGGIDPDDVAQGRLGNCYFLAAIANTATAASDLIVNDLIVEDYADQGIYGVKFYVHGRWVTVVVDDRIPCVPFGSQWMPIFAGLKDHSGQEANVKELWPMIFEKAWAKLHTCYELTAGGDTADATNYLTGGLVTKLEITDSNSQQCWDHLYAVLNPEDSSHLAFCSCNTRYDADPVLLANTGLISGHAYSILKMQVSTFNGVRYIQVRNPWGNSEWNGDWSDKCPKWTEDLALEMGHEDEVDGTFFMSWEDFTAWFGDVQITDPTGAALATEGDLAQIDVYHSALVAGKTAGGPRGASTYSFNPSCQLTVGRDSTVELSLYQADTRGYGLDADGMQLDGQQLTLTLEGPDGTPSNVIDMTPYERVRCVKVYCVAGAAYKLTVSSWAPGIECPFWITAAGWDATLQHVTTPEPVGNEAAMMQRKANQSFSCIACAQPFNGEPYYPMPEGPTCVQCKINSSSAKCSRCVNALSGPYYQLGDENICQPCFSTPQPPALPACYNPPSNML